MQYAVNSNEDSAPKVAKQLRRWVCIGV